MKNNLTVLMIMLVLPFELVAQTGEDSPLLTTTKKVDTEEQIIEQIKLNSLEGQFGFYYSQSVPQATLRQAYDSLGAPEVGYGFSLQGGYSFDPIPVVLGADITFHFWGTKDRNFGPATGDPFRNRVELSTQNFTMPLLAYARVQPNLGTWVFPYAELVGGTTLYSSSFSATRFEADTEVSSNSETEAGFNWTYGVGVGAAIKFADVITLPNTLQRFLLDFRLRYLWGTSVDIPSIEPTENQQYVIRKVTVDAPEQIFFQVGIMIQL